VSRSWQGFRFGDVEGWWVGVASADVEGEVPRGRLMGRVLLNSLR